MLIYKKMGYSAVNVGPHDVKAGVSFLTKNNSLPWVSSNFYSRSNEAIFSQYITQNIDGLQIGVIGVTAPPPHLEKDIVFRHWPDVLPDIIKKASNNNDFIILLSALPQGENYKIAIQFPEIRLIISANLSRGNVSPQKKNNAILTQTGNRGKHLGALTVYSAQSPTWQIDYQNKINIQEKRLATLDWQISKLKNSEEKLEGNSQEINRLQVQKKSIEKILDKLVSENRSMIEADISHSTFDSRFIALTSNIPEDKEIAHEVRVIKNSIQELKTLKSK